MMLFSFIEKFLPYCKAWIHVTKNTMEVPLLMTESGTSRVISSGPPNVNWWWRSAYTVLFVVHAKRATPSGQTLKHTGKTLVRAWDVIPLTTGNICPRSWDPAWQSGKLCLHCIHVQHLTSGTKIFFLIIWGFWTTFGRFSGNPLM